MAVGHRGTICRRICPCLTLMWIIRFVGNNFFEEIRNISNSEKIYPNWWPLISMKYWYDLIKIVSLRIYLVVKLMFTTYLNCLNEEEFFNARDKFHEKKKSILNKVKYNNCFISHFLEKPTYFSKLISPKV